jgi:cytochrome c peroxidase
MKNSFTLPGLAVLLLFSGCTKEAELTATYYEPGDYELLSTYLQLPALPHSYQATLPDHLTMSSLFPVPVDDAQATLGRVLFYDKNLSKDGTVSCAGCHDQTRGFADNAVLSRGVFDRQTSRNSLALGSVVIFSAYYGTDLNGPARCLSSGTTAPAPPPIRPPPP